tara:strand:- start:3193 stop:4050 length:858 start_codon:yes stop_codon:yes gene_type:complete
MKRIHKKTNKTRKKNKLRKGGGPGDIVKETAENVGETVGSALTGTTKIAAKTVKTGTDLAATGVETTGKVGSNVLEGVGEASGAVKGVGTAVSNVGNLVGKTSGDLTDAAGNITGAALEASSDIVTGTTGAIMAPGRAASRYLHAKSDRRIARGKDITKALDYESHKRSQRKLMLSKKKTDSIDECASYLDEINKFKPEKREKYCKCYVNNDRGHVSGMVSSCREAFNKLNELPEENREYIKQNFIPASGGNKRRNKSHKAHKKAKYNSRKSKRQNKRKTHKRRR